MGWLDRYLFNTDDKPEWKEDIGIAADLLDNEPIHISSEIDSMQPSWDISSPSRTQLDLENRYIAKFDARNKEYRVLREEKTETGHPFVQLILPDFEDLEDFPAEIESETPLYLRTAFHQPGDSQTVEAVYAFDTASLNYELVNQKHSTRMESAGKTGMQQVVTGNNAIKEVENAYESARQNSQI